MRLLLALLVLPAGAVAAETAVSIAEQNVVLIDSRHSSEENRRAFDAVAALCARGMKAHPRDAAFPGLRAEAYFRSVLAMDLAPRAKAVRRAAALRDIGLAIRLMPKNDWFYYVRSRIWCAVSCGPPERARALADLQRAHRLHPAHRPYTAELASRYREAGDEDAAKFWEARTLGPDDMSDLASWIKEQDLEYYRVTGGLARAGEPEVRRRKMLDGEALCSKVLDHAALRADKAEWTWRRASFRRMLSDPAVSSSTAADEYRGRALEDLDKAIGLDRLRGDFFRDRALVRCCVSGDVGTEGCAAGCQGPDRRDAAVADLERAAKLSPESASAFLGQAGDWFRATRDLVKAVAYYRRASAAAKLPEDRARWDRKLSELPAP